MASTSAPRFGYYIIRVLPKGTPLSGFFLAAVNDARFNDFSAAVDALEQAEDAPIPLINGFYLLACLPKTTAVWKPNYEVKSCKTAFIAKSDDVEGSMRLMIPMNHPLSQDLTKLLKPDETYLCPRMITVKRPQSRDQPTTDHAGIEEARLDQVLEQSAAETLCLLGGLNDTVKISSSATTSKIVKRKKTFSLV